MTTPYYADDSVTLWHGDCLEVLAALPPASVDAVVTDPPYGLEFMGREWDTFGRAEAQSMAAGGMSATGYTDGAARLERPSFLGGLNPRCTSCGRSQRGGSPCRCETPSFTDERGPRMVAFQEFSRAWATECLRVLKPGGHLLAFGGTRTAHRLTAGIEDAEFEIRDTITWLYGSGFPKSLDVSKAIDKAAGAEREVVGVNPYAARRPNPPRSATYEKRPSRPDGYFADQDNSATAPATDDARRWQGWGTALKPASEPIVVARKPLAGTVAQTVQAYGTGALNIDGCRVAGDVPSTTQGQSGNAGTIYGADQRDQRAFVPNGAGRWPANVVFTHAASPDGADLCAAGCVPGCPVADLDAQSGVLTSGANPTRRASPKFGTAYGDFTGSIETPARGVDSGGASRFFPTFRYEAKAPNSERPRADGAAHPTVKPLELMRWLVRLVTPPGGLVLDPFAGSGTTAEACVLEGLRCTTVEREAAYLPLIRARIGKPLQPALFVIGGL